jgi:hypothetical protein
LFSELRQTDLSETMIDHRGSRNDRALSEHRKQTQGCDTSENLEWTGVSRVFLGSPRPTFKEFFSIMRPFAVCLIVAVQNVQLGQSIRNSEPVPKEWRRSRQFANSFGRSCMRKRLSNFVGGVSKGYTELSPQSRRTWGSITALKHKCRGSVRTLRLCVSAGAVLCFGVCDDLNRSFYLSIPFPKVGAVKGARGCKWWANGARRPQRAGRSRAEKSIQTHRVMHLEPEKRTPVDRKSQNTSAEFFSQKLIAIFEKERPRATSQVGRNVQSDYLSPPIANIKLHSSTSSCCRLEV